MKTTDIHWEITNKCNLHCSYCRSGSGRPRPHELSTAEALAALKKISDAGIKRIFYTGGEAFSRPDFQGLLEEAIRLKLKVSVITNATLIDQKTIDLIKDLGIGLSISLDSAIASINDKQRGRGNFSKVLRVLEYCRLRKLRPHLYVTVTKSNLSHLEELMRFAQEHSAPLHFKEVSDGGRADRFYNGRLSSREENRLKNLIPKIVKKVFNDEIIVSDENCWANGKNLFMTAEGDLYYCNEIFVRRPDLKLGNIKTFCFNQIARNRTKAKLHCCYGALISANTSTIYNTEFSCELLDNQEAPIKTLKNLYQALDNLYEGIGDYCFQCQEKDCMGYVWLLKVEADRLYRSGVPIVQVNEGPTFIHSFPKDQAGNINLSVPYPVCSQVDCTGRICSIRKKRPLVCHLYPAGLETLENGKIIWEMHLDCLFIQKMEAQGLLNDLENKFLSIVNRISPPLLEEIMEAYKAANAISIFPNGRNNTKVLKGGE